MSAYVLYTWCCRQLEATLHEDNLKVATRGTKPRTSTCSELIEGYVEDVFETPSDLHDMTVPIEEIEPTTEHVETYEASKFDHPTIHTLEEIQVKVWVLDLYAWFRLFVLMGLNFKNHLIQIGFRLTEPY